MMRVVQKLRTRFRQFGEHPVTSRRRNKALFNYIFFNLGSSLRHELRYNWIGSLKIFVRKGDAGLVGNVYFGLAEFYESMFILHFLRDSDLFLDVGANLGHYSLLAAGCTKSQVIAVEPVPATFEQLNRQIRLNKLEDRVQTLNRGMADHSSELWFSTDRGTMNHIVDERYRGSRTRVRVDTIDSICEVNIPGVIKIDVEGYEKFVLDGAHKTLRDQTVKALIVELNRSGEKFGIDDRNIFQHLVSLGFRPFSYDPFNRSIVALDTYNTGQFNTIFVRDVDFVNKRILNSSPVKIWDRTF